MNNYNNNGGYGVGPEVGNQTQPGFGAMQPEYGNQTQPGFGGSQPQQEDQGMKTTDAINLFMQNFGRNSAPVSKMIEKIQALDDANGEIRRQQAELKRKKRNLIILIVATVVVLLFLVLSMLFGVRYASNKQKGNRIYKYFFGMPVSEVCPEENLNAWFVSEDGDWLYFSRHFVANDEEDRDIYRVRKNGKDLTRVCLDCSGYPMVYGEYIYYINCEDISNPTLCRVPKDARDAEGEVLYEDPSFPICIDEGLGTVDGMVAFEVYDKQTAEQTRKFLDVTTMKFYNEKK